MALEVARVEVLTNGRRYIRNHVEALCELRDQYSDRLTLRITLESTSAAVHDKLRGQGTFDQTVETIVMLARMGFRVVVTAEREFVGDGTEAVGTPTNLSLPRTASQSR